MDPEGVGGWVGGCVGGKEWWFVVGRLCVAKHVCMCAGLHIDTCVHVAGSVCLPACMCVDVLSYVWKLLPLPLPLPLSLPLPLPLPCGPQVPQFLYEAGYGCKDFPERAGAIGITQPRRWGGGGEEGGAPRACRGHRHHTATQVGGGRGGGGITSVPGPSASRSHAGVGGGRRGGGTTSVRAYERVCACVCAFVRACI